MAINPDNITTIRVDQLPEDTLNLTNDFAHSNGTELKKATIQSLVDLVSTAIGSSSGVGYLAISVTDGQQLPDVPTEAGFFLAGAGTYLNINGYPDVICTENLNAIMSLTDHWELAVEIPINPLSGTVQSVTGSAVDNTDPLNPVINTTGGGGAVDSVNGQTGVVTLGLTEILTESATATDLPVKLEDSSLNTYVEYTGFDTRIKEIGTNNNIFNYGGFGNFYVWDGVNPNYKQQFSFDPSGSQGQNFILPSKPTGNYTVATLDDIPSSSAYKFVDATQATYLGAVIGLAETAVAQTTILGGTFNSSDLMKILFRVTKSTTSASVNMRIRVNTTNNLGTATQIGILTLGAVSTYGLINRHINLFGGNAYNYNSASTLASDILLTNTAGTSFTYNTANDLYVFFTIQLGNVLDSATFQFANITN